MHKLDRFALNELNQAIKSAFEQRQSLLTKACTGVDALADTILTVAAYERAFELLEEYWPEIRERVDTTFPSDLVFPRRDHQS